MTVSDLQLNNRNDEDGMKLKRKKYLYIGHVVHEQNEEITVATHKDVK